MPITTAGFQAETIEEVEAKLQADLRSTLANDLDFDPDQPLAQMVTIDADESAETQSAISVAYNAFDRGSAEGRQLDIVGDIIGLPRLGAQKPRVRVRVQLTAGGTVTAGDAINPAGQPSNSWTALSTFTAPADGTYTIVFEALADTQSVPASTTWAFPALPGWVALSNVDPSSAARARETDTEYRNRQEASLARPGSGASDSLAADLRDVPGVLQATVYENPRSFDVDGLPPHAFEAVIYDGPTLDASDSAIAQVIWENKPPGSAFAFGTTTATAYDELGQPRTILFSRAAQKRMVIQFTLQVLPGWLDTQLQALRDAIVQSFTLRRTGEDVPTLKVKSVAIAQPYAYDVVGYSQGIYPGPYADTTTTIGRREVATLAPADLLITVVQLPAAP